MNHSTCGVGVLDELLNYCYFSVLYFFLPMFAKIHRKVIVLSYQLNKKKQLIVFVFTSNLSKYEVLFKIKHPVLFEQSENRNTFHNSLNVG